MSSAPKGKELRCFCARKPLLGTYGINSRGKLYVHIKIFKQQRIFGEILTEDGTVKLRCRECLRWHTVIVVQPDTAILREETVMDPRSMDAPAAVLEPPRPPV